MTSGCASSDCFAEIGTAQMFQGSEQAVCRIAGLCGAAELAKPDLISPCEITPTGRGVPTRLGSHCTVRNRGGEITQLQRLPAVGAPQSSPRHLALKARRRVLRVQPFRPRPGAA